MLVLEASEVGVAHVLGRWRKQEDRRRGIRRMRTMQSEILILSQLLDLVARQVHATPLRRPDPNGSALSRQPYQCPSEGSTVYHVSVIDSLPTGNILPSMHPVCITIVAMNSSAEVVYLIDDDSRLREALRGLLEAHGRTVLTFDSAQGYLAHARSDTAACLILDLELPGTNGLDLQQQLGPQSGPPIIFISGRGDIPKTVRAMKAGAIEFLTKPVLPETLLAAVTTALAMDREARKHQIEVDGLRKRLDSLTPREREVLPLVISGLRNKQGAAVLGITEFTFQVHRGQIMRKMRAKSFAELVRMGLALGVA